MRDYSIHFPPRRTDKDKRDCKDCKEDGDDKWPFVIGVSCFVIRHSVRLTSFRHRNTINTRRFQRRKESTLLRESQVPSTEFLDLFGPGPISIARAPGRVNLIGDHTDYNGGYVLPAAIDREARIAFRPSNDSRVEIAALDFSERAAFDLTRPDPASVPAWARYPMGVAAILQQEGHILRGARMALRSDVPIGAGLSSSAAVEAASALAFCSAANLRIAPEELARICQRAENEFVGMRCGIMDQFVSLLGKRGCALFLDCSTLRHSLAPLDDAKAQIVVCDTRVKRELTRSPYNQRREECEKALAIIRQHAPAVASYHDLNVILFKAQEHHLPELLRKRARHVVTENGRVVHAAKMLRAGDLIAFGALMDASHDSLRDDFEVSCPELDLLVEVARQTTGVFGSRMTGGGFGGCTVTLVAPEHAAEFSRAAVAGFKARFGREPVVHMLKASDGATVESAKP